MDSIKKHPFYIKALNMFKNDSEFHKEYCAEPVEKGDMDPDIKIEGKNFPILVGNPAESTRNIAVSLLHLDVNNNKNNAIKTVDESMDDKKEQLMTEAQLYCDDNDKSTEFMLEYMQSVASATLDEVLDFLQKQSDPTE